MAARNDATTGGRRRLGRGLQSLISSPVEVPIPVQDDPAPARSSSPRTTSDAGTATSAETRESTATRPAEGRPPAPESESASRAAGSDKLSTSEEPRDLVTAIELDRLIPNRHQPRRDFDDDALDRLGASIRSAGVMQPIVVRPADSEGRHEIIAGERRWRAAKRIDLRRIPAIIREVDDRTSAEWALMENLQREDLNPIDRAEAFHKLSTDFGLTHQEIATAVGLDRPTVSNQLRLLDLDSESRDALRSGQIDAGHGRALLGCPSTGPRQELLKAVIRQGWSVRELERRVRALAASGQSAAATPGSTTDPSPTRMHLDDLERALGDHLGTKVAIHSGRKKGTGRLSIQFYTLDQFEGLLERLGFSPD